MERTFVAIAFAAVQTIAILGCASSPLRTGNEAAAQQAELVRAVLGALEYTKGTQRSSSSFLLSPIREGPTSARHDSTLLAAVEPSVLRVIDPKAPAVMDTMILSFSKPYRQSDGYRIRVGYSSAYRSPTGCVGGSGGFVELLMTCAIQGCTSRLLNRASGSGGCKEPQSR